MGWTTHMVTQQEDQQGGGIGRQTSAEASALKLGGRGKTSRLKGGVYVGGTTTKEPMCQKHRQGRVMRSK